LGSILNYKLDKYVGNMTRNTRSNLW